MKIVWDEQKRLVNLERHKMDFVELDVAFFEAAVARPAKNGRLIAVGRLASSVITVIFIVLGTEAFSVISMRHASRKERRRVDG